MRIRFGTRGFLLLIAVILAASYFGYRYYYLNHKILGRLQHSTPAGKFKYYWHRFEFQSTEFAQVELTIIENAALISEKRRALLLKTNTAYELHFEDGVFSLREVAKPPESAIVLNFFPGYSQLLGEWHIPDQGLALTAKDPSRIFAFIPFAMGEKMQSVRLAITLLE